MHEYLKVEEVALRWRVHKSTVTRMINRGELKAIQIGTAYRIRREDLEEYEAAVAESE